MKNVSLCMDIGGTKIAYGLFQQNTLVYNHEKKAEKGLTALSRVIKTIEEDCQAIAKKNHWILDSVVRIGAPGKLIGTEACVIEPGSAKNLGIYPEEFDNLNWKTWIQTSLDKPIDVAVFNDALCQCRGGIEQLKSLKMYEDFFRNKKLAYIGPGTGLGGALAVCDETGYPKFYSDGHIFDIMLDGKMAEDELSGRAFYEKTGHHASELVASDMPVLDEMGRTMASVMMRLYSGQVEKRNGQSQWSTSVLDTVKDTDLFLIGGSLGTAPDLSPPILSSCTHYLKQVFNDRMPFSLIKIPNPKKAALLGALLLAERPLL